MIAKIFVVLLAVFWLFRVEHAFAYSPELKMQTGHSDRIRSLCLSPDGKILVSGCADKSIKLWDLDSMRELRTLSGHSGAVSSVSISPDGKLLASASIEDGVKIWDLSSGDQLDAPSGSIGPVERIALSPDGTLVAAGCSDKRIILWDVKSQRILRTLVGHEGAVTNVLFFANGTRLASASEDHRIRIWDAGSGREIAVLNEKTDDGFSEIAIDANSRYLAASSGLDIKLWDLKSCEKLRIFSGHTEPVASLAFSADGKKLISGDASNFILGSGSHSIRFWSVESGDELRSIPCDSDVPAICLEPDGTVISGHFDGSIKLWDASKGTETGQLVGTACWLGCIAISPDGKTVAMGTDDNCILLLRIDTGDLKRLVGHSEKVSCLLFLPDGNLVSGSEDDSLRIWSSRSGAPLQTCEGHEDDITSLAVSSDGKILVSASADKNIKLWDGSSFKELRTLTGHTDRVTSISLSSGKILASGSWDKTVIIWDINSGRRIKKIENFSNWISSLSISADGRTLAVATGSGDKPDNSIGVWTLPSATKTGELVGNKSWVTSVNLSADGKTLLSGCFDNSLLLWDVQTRSMKCRLDNGTPVGLITQSADGRLVLVDGFDKTIKFVEVDGLKDIATMSVDKNHDWVVVSRDGRFDSSNLDKIESLVWVLPDRRMRVSPIEVFFRQYYEPNLAWRLIRSEPLQAVPDLMTINRVQPFVKIESVVASTENPNEVVVTVAFKSQLEKRGDELCRSGVFDLRLFRDGQLVAYLPEDESFASNRSSDLTKSSDDEMRQSFKVRLARNGSGKTMFSAYAFNGEKVKSRTAMYEYSNTSPQRRAGNAYVIAFGVNSYSDPTWDLRYAAADARAFGTDLLPRLAESGTFEKVFFIPLVSDTVALKDEILATKENLRDVLLSLAGEKTKNTPVAALLHRLGISKVDPEDFVLLAFSCHGSTNGAGEFFLFPSDIGKNQNTGLTPKLEEYGISSAELTDWLKDVDASELTLIIDACYSGAASGKDFKPGPLNDASLGQLAYYKRMRILAASQAAKTAQEASNLGHGLLTFAFLKEGLAGDWRADLEPTDNKITMKELLKFAKDDVPLLDQGGYKKRSIEKALLRDIAIINPSPRKRDLQEPILLDFCNKEGRALLRKSQD